MVNALRTLDWTLIQAFVAVAEHGSLSAAARHLGSSQPTLSRQIAAVESSLGAPVFDRKPRAMRVNAFGAQLLEPARTMAEAARKMALIAAGSSQSIAGTVRITASVFMSHHILPAILSELRLVQPEISVELVASDASDNLLFNEADIAIRMYRPRQLDVVTQHLGDIELALFGAKSYLDRAGRPQTIDELTGHAIIGYDTQDDIIRGMRALGYPVDREWFPMRCDHQTVYWELVRAGCGLGFGQLETGKADGSLEHVVPDLPLPSLPVWLTAHEKMRNSARVRVVWDLLAMRLRQVVS